MRPIRLAHLDGDRPVVVLTRASVRAFRSRVTIAPITTTIRGTATELPVGPDNGLDRESVIDADNITTIAAADLGQQIGFLLESQEAALIRVIQAAFDLD